MGYYAKRDNVLYIACITSFSGARGGAVGLRHCATSRKVAGSIPDGFIGIFH